MPGIPPLAWQEVEMSTPPSFGHTLKHYRKASDLTQEQLAEHVCCSVETIKKIEAGKLRPGKQLAELLTLHLAVPPEDRTAFLKAARAEPRPDWLALPTRPMERAAGEEVAPAPADTTKPPLPQGTLTFLLTDIEASTHLWEQ